MQANRFEELLKDLDRHSQVDQIRGAIIDIADTMYLCKAWFEDNALEAAPGDVVAMARLIIEREAWRATQSEPDFPCKS